MTTTLPAVARAGYDALNSDKVDGKHAVSAGATAKARRGKLVATSPKTGRLPNDIIAKAPDTERLDGLDSTAFLPRNGKSVDSDELDGADIRQIKGVATSILVPGVGQLGAARVLKEVTLNLPSAGRLVVNGQTKFLGDQINDTHYAIGETWVTANPDGDDDNWGTAFWLIKPGMPEQSPPTMPMTRTLEVSRPGPMTIYVMGHGSNGIGHDSSVLNVMFLPN